MFSEEGVREALAEIKAELEQLPKYNHGLFVDRIDSEGRPLFYGIFDGPFHSLVTVNPQTHRANGKEYVICTIGDPSDRAVGDAAKKFLGAYAKEIGCELSHGIPR